MQPEDSEKEKEPLLPKSESDESDSTLMKENTSINNHTEVQVSIVQPPKPEKSLSLIRLLLLTVSFSGNIMCWSVEIAYATPFLLEIGIGRTFVSYNWLIGPLSALFVQPIVGYISDKLFIPFIGRRKPFLLLGVILCAICLLLFAFCDLIGEIFYTPPPNGVNYVSIVIGMIAFCVLDGSINTVHSAIKTLTIDVVPSHQQTTANLLLAFFAGFGNTLGFLIGSIDFVGRLKMSFLVRNIRPVYVICVIWLLFSSALTFFSVWEKKDLKKKKKLQPDPSVPEIDEEEKIENEENVKKEISSVVEQSEQTSAKIIGDAEVPQIPQDFEMHRRPERRTCWQTMQLILPYEIFVAYWIRFMIYFAKFFCFVFMSDTVGLQIFHGDPKLTPSLVEKYEAGVRWSSLCFSLLSIFNMVNSPIINFLTEYSPFSNRITYKVIWGVCQSFQFIGLSLVYWVENQWILLVIFYFLSFMETACISFPYAIFNTSVKSNAVLKKYKGIAAGIFVSSQCVPEIIVSVIGGPVAYLLIERMKLNYGIMISIGGLMAGIALVLILFLRIPEGIVKKKKIKDFFVVRWTVNVVVYIKKVTSKKQIKVYEEIKDDDDNVKSISEGIIHDVKNNFNEEPKEESEVQSLFFSEQQQQQVEEEEEKFHL